MTSSDAFSETRSDARVRLVSPGFPPARGGVEEHCYRLAVHLAGFGDRVDVLTAHRRAASTAAATEADAALPRGVRVRRYSAWRTTAMSISPRLTFAALTAGRRTADITHVHSYHATSGFAALAGFRIPVVFTPHYHGSGHTALARALHIGYRMAGHAMFSAARAVICVSEAERDAVVRDFPKVAGRIRVIPNGVDTAAIRAAHPRKDEPPTVLTIGRLEPYKNVDVIVRAMASLPDAQLVVIGAGRETDRLKLLAAELGIAERVRLVGNVPERQLHEWMHTAAVLASLSDHEAFGMVPLEAATAGARTVLSDIPAHREISRTWLGDSAQLVTKDDVARVAEALGRALGAGGRVEANVPDWADVAALTHAVYREALEAPTPKGRRRRAGSRSAVPSSTGVQP